MEPAFRPRLRATLDDAFFPQWTERAACSSYSSPGAVWSWMFAEEVSERPDPKPYSWPDKSLQAMRVCATCPVRRECAEWAYGFEKSESDEWWSGEPVENDRRFGIYAGIPGRMRERFAPHPDRIERGEAWFRELAAKRGWPIVPDLDPPMTIEASTQGGTA